ncbi:MAG: hypothetical protein GF387_02335, partial [Candidatus Portnoybacteria bacterium]|nr:hypothetical protein [Candidatus Portnoybacteria bacterium]
MARKRRKTENQINFISLQEAAEIYGCTARHLSLMARQGKLKAVKIGRNWMTTKEWLEEYSPSKKEEKLIPLSEAAVISGYTTRHLSLMARQGKLKAEKKEDGWLTTKKWLDNYVKKFKTAPKKITDKKEEERRIPLSSAAKAYGCTTRHLSLMARQGKLKAEKREGKWFTTFSWLEEYARSVEKEEKTRVPFSRLFKQRFAPKIKKALITATIALLIFSFISAVYVYAKEGSISINKPVKENGQEINNKIKKIKDAYLKIIKAKDPEGSLAFDVIEKQSASVDQRAVKIKASTPAKNINKTLLFVIREPGLTTTQTAQIADALLTNWGHFAINTINISGKFIGNTCSAIGDTKIVKGIGNFFSSIGKTIADIPKGIKNMFAGEEDTEQMDMLRGISQQINTLRDEVKSIETPKQDVVVHETKNINQYITINEAPGQVPTEITGVDDLKNEILMVVNRRLDEMDERLENIRVVENNYYYEEAAQVAGFDTVNNEVDFNENVDMKKNLTVLGSIIGGSISDGTATLEGGNLMNLRSISVEHASVSDDLTVSGPTKLFSDLYVDEDTLYIDSTNDYVGIGTISPTTELDIQGTANISQDVIINRTIQVGTTTSTSYSRFGTATTSHGLIDASDLLISGDLEVDGRTWLDNSASISGNLDIGGDLNVSGNITGGSITYNTASVSEDFEVGDGIFYVNTGSESYQFGGTGTASFIGPVNISQDLNVSEGDLFVDDSSGNIGIGTTNPGYKLSVDGTASVSGVLTLNNYLDFGQISTPSTNTGRLFSSDQDDSLWYYNGSGWVDLTTAGTGALTGTGTNNYITKWSGSSTLDNSVMYEDSSNIGIGTTTPDSKLEVSGNIHATTFNGLT